MNLHEVHHGVHRRRHRKRIGRGPGSGHGKTATRGHKGQRSRSGSMPRLTFEGGQMPLARRVPKRGFTNRWRKLYVIVNVGQLQHAFDEGANVDPESLRQKGIIKGKYDGVKILADGQLDKKLHVRAHRFSQAAIQKIEKAGGQAVPL